MEKRYEGVFYKMFVGCETVSGGSPDRLIIVCIDKAIADVLAESLAAAPAEVFSKALPEGVTLDSCTDVCVLVEQYEILNGEESLIGTEGVYFREL